MKTWNKPSMTVVPTGFEATRYLSAEIGSCKRR